MPLGMPRVDGNERAFRRWFPEMNGDRFSQKMSTDEQKNKQAGADICPSKHKQLDLAAVKAQIERTTGPEYWHSLEELAGSEEFQEMLHREFPKGASEWLDAFSRRGFLKTMGASLALAGLTGCTRMPVTQIVPYVKQPENVIPGRPK